MKLGKTVFVAMFFVFAFFPFVSFAASETSAVDLQIIALLREQIRLLEEIIKILTARLAVSAPPVPIVSLAFSVPTPMVSAEEKPFVRISADGSGGKISVKKGESVVLSWELSRHSWSYCNKFFGWDGGFKPINGSEESRPLFADTIFKVICYLENQSFEDSVTVKVLASEEMKKVEDTFQPATSSTYSLVSGGGFESCLLSVYPLNVTLGKDALEATWIIDSGPRSAHFYWRGKDNGVDIGKIYGGKTKRTRIFDYTPYPAKYERYVEMFLDSKYILDDPYTPKCITDTVIFEVKK